MHVVTILGARPQFVKASAVSRALARHQAISETMIHTGQHFDANMSDIFFSELNIRVPEYNLDIHGMTHGAMTGRMLEEVEKVLLQSKPDVVLVYGDTDSTLAGALAAVKLHIPVAHVEAGLRAFNLHIPEEVNRVMTDHISEILFTPTDAADQNLSNEGITGDRVHQVGDVMYDAMLYYSGIAEEKSKARRKLELNSGEYILATIHRPQNTDSREALLRVADLLDKLAEHTRVVLPVHPRTRKRLNEFGIQLKQVIETEPLGFLDMIDLEKHAGLILTDSGGVQKEAYFHRVPCVTLRPETEWVELVAHGWNIILPPSDDTAGIAAKILGRMGVQGEDVQLYGSGKASELIADILLKRFGNT
jgi:UDP-GlcNAc3NAcA epimerase